ncbi:MAG: hypothetical protein JOZ48_08080 [Acidobacteriaceae bacterium]|nr:hypothetical protein [Acidobacteriaceae bacterium]
MALFTDADIVTLNDLLTFESSLVQIASSHGIDVDTKINLSLSAISDRLMLWLISAGASDPQWLNRRLLGLSTVVVTPTLRRWLCLDSLSRFFAEAYNVQLNTRFQGKWTEYQQAASDASEMAFMSGIGIVYNPLPKPAMPVITSGVGSGTAQGMFVQTAWVDAHGDESAPSPVNGIILDGASNVRVAMAEGLLSTPSAAAGWNLYAGTVGDELTRQNSAPLAIGETWQVPSSGLVNGPEPISGQQPNYYIALSKPLQRG